MLSNHLFLLFFVMIIGYVIGRIKIGGINLGAAGILLVALVFGHFGYELPSVIQNTGLVCFVAAVGIIAGPNFFENFKGKAKAYVVIGACIIISGVLACLAVIQIIGISTDLSLGLLAGALTTTPGLAAGIEATGSDMVSIGYGIAYPFGVIGVVLFVQLVPKLLHADLEKEKRELERQSKQQGRIIPEDLIKFDSYGLLPFSLAIVSGLLIGQIKIPLPGGGTFSLGSSGGPLFTGILLGHFKKINIFDMQVKNSVLVTMRELGLAFFLAGAGTHAGAGFIQVLSEQGALLFLYAALMTIIPLFVGYLVAKIIFKLNSLDTMGSICGGMTSTPALGTLISSSGTDDVTSSYAATYPVALALIVLLIELIGGKMV